MKKRFWSFLVMVVMILSLSVPAFADDIEVPQSIWAGTYIQDGLTHGSGANGMQNAKLVIPETGCAEITFNMAGYTQTFQYTFEIDSFEDYVILSENNSGEEIHSFAMEQGNEMYFFANGYFGDKGVPMKKIESDPEPILVSQGFTGTAVSDRGDYDLFLAGYFNKELTDGTHVLSSSDIAAQTIAVIAHNNANEINRNMNQTTIEEMTVTVSGGMITEYIIRGRVQTNGGSLDRYTAIINP